MWTLPEREQDDQTVETERWCAGLISVGLEPLDDSERAELTHWSRMLLGTALLIALAASALIVWPFLLPLAFWQRDDMLTTLATAGMLLSWVLALPVAGLMLVDVGRRYLRHTRDLLVGEVERFEGSLDGGRLDREQKALLKAGVFDATEAGGQSLRVFPHSDTVRVQGRRGPARWRAVRVRTVAAGPSYEMRVTIPRESVGVADPRVEILRRRMTHDEKREIELRARRMGEAWKVLLLQALVGLIAYALIFRTIADHATVTIVSAIVLAAWSVHRARQPVEAIRLAGQLKRDAQAGLVLTHRRRPARPGADEANPSAADGDWVDVEFLPVSSLSWTVRGRPARWRDLMAPAWRLPQLVR